MRTMVICILLLAAVLFGLAVGLQQVELRADQMPAALIGAAAAVFALLVYLGSKLDAHESRAAWDSALKEDEAMGCPPCNSQCGQGRNCPADAAAAVGHSDDDLDEDELYTSTIYGHKHKTDPLFGTLSDPCAKRMPPELKREIRAGIRAQQAAGNQCAKSDADIDAEAGESFNASLHGLTARKDPDAVRAQFDAESA